MPTSPSVDNLSLLTGIVYGKRIGVDNDYVDLGEVSAFTTSFTPDKLDYFSKRGPAARSKVKSVVREKTITLSMTMNEFTARQLQMFMMGGDIETNSDGDAEFDLGAADEQLYQIKYVGTNEIGNQVEVELLRVDMAPNGELNLLPDEWGEIPVQGEVLYDSTAAKYGTAILRDTQSS